MAGKINYAYLDESPVVFDNDKAFEWVQGQTTAGRWVPLHMADARSKARRLTASEFNDYAARSGASGWTTLFH